MRTRKAALILTSCLMLLGISFKSAASTSAVDLPGFGQSSGLLDTTTGLTWLNLKFSRDLSYNEVIGLTASGGMFSGWRYATANEWSALYSAFGFDTNNSMYIPNPSLQQISAMNIASSLLGNLSKSDDSNDMDQGGLVATSLTPGTHQLIYWSYDYCLNNPNCGTPLQLSTYGQYFPQEYYGISAFNMPDGSSSFASYLVQASSVPEPSTVLLLLGGLMILFRRVGRINVQDLP